MAPLGWIGKGLKIRLPHCTMRIMCGTFESKLRLIVNIARKYTLCTMRIVSARHFSEQRTSRWYYKSDRSLIRNYYTVNKHTQHFTCCRHHSSALSTQSFSAQVQEFWTHDLMVAARADCPGPFAIAQTSSLYPSQTPPPHSWVCLNTAAPTRLV